jgi:integrase
LSKLVKLLRDGGASETTIATYLRHVGTALRWAADIGLIRAAPKVPRVKPPKKEKAMRGRPITGEEFDRLVKAVPKVRPRDAAVWVHYLNGLWLSGLRLEESTIVSWDSDQPFSIDLTGKHPTFRILAEAQKARRDESLPMTPDFAEFILQTPEGQRYGRVFKLPLASNGKLRPEKVGTVVSAIGQKAGVVVNKTEGKFASAHDLRRSFGTRWARKVRPAVLQRLMRHKDIATTQKYYVALDTDDIAAEIWGTVNPNVNPSRPGAQIERDNGAEANERTRCGATS